MTLWSSPHPKESAALSLSQAQKGSEVGKFKELSDSEATIMPSSATSFASDGSEDAGFEDGSIDVDMGEEETESIQIDCIQTLTELDPIIDGELNGTDDSPLMSDCKTPIPLPPPPVHIGSGAFGGNQAYVNMQNNIVPRIMERPTSPIQSYWGSSSTSEAIVHSSRTRGDVGLNNIGNTCFMNSGLQCLVHTSPLVEFFVGSDSFERTVTSLVYQFNSLMNHVWFGEKGAISLLDFKLVLGNKYAQFKDCRQHDCQEFLAVLLDMLHEELKLKQKAALSVVDSSVVGSYVEVCSSSEKTHDNQYSVSTSCMSSSKTEASPTSSKEHKEVTKVRPVSKRPKLENSEGFDSVDEPTVVNPCEEPDEVKRKSPFSKPRVNDKHNSENPEVPAEDNDASNVNEVSGSLDVQCRFNENPNSCPILKAQTYWNKYMKENDTVIASTFQGMFKSAVTCSECSFISETYEPFMYLSLPIPRVMEKKLNVTYISMKDRSPMRVEVTIQLMGTVENLIQEVIKKVNNCGLDNSTKYAVAEICNHRISRVLEDKSQLRNLSTNSRNIYVYELNDNFDGSYSENVISDVPPPTLKKEKYSILSVPEYGVRHELKKSTITKWDSERSADESIERCSSNVSSRSLPTYGPIGAPVGGGVYVNNASSSAIKDVASSSDDSNLPQIENENFNRIQCNICLEDYPRNELKKHRGCSCVLCEECLMKSVEHFKSEGGKTQEGSFVKCAVCLQTVECKKAFASLDESSTLSSPEFIKMPILFRNEPGTDANNNSSWSSGLFGYPWLIYVPSFLSASELTDFVASINPVPEANHRLLSVKSDGKSCGQCVFSTRCNGCEIPREGMISLNSCNSILISFIDLPSERLEHMQPPDMAVHSELSTSWQFNRNDEPTIDIHDCLRTFSETEHLDEQNPWYCPRCQKNQRATKSLSICRFPDYLIVYLKRFVFMDQSSNKLNNRLTFPINDLDVSDYVTEGFGTDVGKYNLYSCVCHFGSASAGHYTAYAKNPVTSKWHYFNDETIAERSPAESEYSSAYVLFYEKKGMDYNIPTKCSKPLPELNSFNTSTYNADTRGSYLPGETNVSSGPVRVNDFMNEVNLQVDSTSPNFSFPHVSTEADLLGLEDEGVGNETNNVIEIHDGLDLTETEVVTSSTSGPDDELLNNDLDFDNYGGSDVISTSTRQYELPTSSGGGPDSTSN